MVRLILISLLLLQPSHAQRSTPAGDLPCQTEFNAFANFIGRENVVNADGKDKFSFAVTDFLTQFSKSYLETPDFDEYKRRLDANNFRGDYGGAYQFMQSFSRDLRSKQFAEIQTVLMILLNAKPEWSEIKNYGECLKNHMITTIEALPNSTHFIINKEQILQGIRILQPR